MPLPSEPTTRHRGSGRRRQLVQREPRRPPPGRRPRHPASCTSPARASGSRRGRPAPGRRLRPTAFHAPAVIPAARRSGTITPWPPNAATDRSTAPRFPGVGDNRPARRTSGVSPDASRRPAGRPGARTRRTARPASAPGAAPVAHPGPARGAAPPAAGCPGPAASFIDSRTRSSRVDVLRDVQRLGGDRRAQRLDHRVPARDLLRASRPGVYRGGVFRRAPSRPGCAGWTRRRAWRQPPPGGRPGCLVRSSAFGVGPRPSRPCLRCPPEPFWAPLRGEPACCRDRRGRALSACHDCPNQS